MTKHAHLDLDYHKWTVADYHKLAGMGMFDDQRVELISGEIIHMSPIGKLHAATVKAIAALLWAAAGDSGIISVQDPVMINDHSEPEPDLAILKPNPSFYAERLPGPDDILLVIEVADSTLEKDRQVKLPLYAASGIPEYWIVNLSEEVLE